MSYLVFDLETGTKEFAKRKGSPWHNDIVAVGLKYQTLDARALYQSYMTQEMLKGIYTLVGFNIKYDLLYIWKHDWFQEWLKQGGKIWDCQYVHYLLSGQNEKYPALRKTAVNTYGCKERPKLMEPYWEDDVKVVDWTTKKIIKVYPKTVSNVVICKDLDLNNYTKSTNIVRGRIDTKDIPSELVLEDVSNDVLDTEQIYLKQLDLVNNKNLLPLIEGHMDTILATTEIEFNGFYTNLNELQKNKQKLENLCLTQRNKLYILIQPYWLSELGQFNLDSPTQLSQLLFGAKTTITTKEPIFDGVEFETYKSGQKAGQLKLQNVDKEILIQGLGVSSEGQKATKTGTFCVNEDTLVALNSKYKEGDVAKIIQGILELRGLQKQLSTYYTSTEEKLYPDNCVHAQYCHVATDTTRLGCTNPNMQNQPDSNASLVKKHFTSRYLNGKIITVDYTQLEVRVLAELAKDPNFTKDILNGVDFHSKYLGLKEKVPYDQIIRAVLAKDQETVQKRKKIKSFTFSRQYGAGVWKISKESGLTEQEVLELIKAQKKEYPGIEAFTERQRKQVEAMGFYKCSITNKMYTFQPLKKPKKDDEYKRWNKYSYPQIKNYQVQGLAWDIVAILLGKLWREKIIHNRDKYLLINTVHDDIEFDCKEEYVTQLKKDVQILTNVQDMMYHLFKYNWNVPLKIEIKEGHSWYEC